MFPMAYDKTRALAALADFQRSNDLKDARWERASGVGGGTLRKFRDTPGRSLNSSTYAKLASGASTLLNRPVTMSEFSGEGAASVVDPVAMANAARAPDAALPPYRSEMPKDVPVFGTIVGGTSDQFDFELNGTIVDYVRRPPRFNGRIDVFAAYVQGTSMSPWREPGQIVYLESVKPPRNRDYVLVEMKPRDVTGVRPALLKRLISVTPTKVKLQQFQPPREFDIDRASVLRMYRVVELDEMFGV